MIDKRVGEGQQDYIKRITLLKMSGLIDLGHQEWYKLCFNKDISQDESRKRYYSIKALYEVEDIENEENTRILTVSDFHYPNNLDIDVLGEYANKVDILVFNGDVQDNQSLSKFSKLYRENFIDETIGTRQMMIDIINMINPKKVLVNYGNHEERLGNYIAKKLDDDMVGLMPKTSTELVCETGITKYDHKLKKKEYYEPLVKIFDNVEYTNNWWCKVGRTLFIHPRSYKSGILATTQKAMEYFNLYGEDFDCVCLGHTHKTSLTRMGRKFLLEQGCLCKPQEYATSGNLQIPQSNGFAYIVQDNQGNFIYDKSKLIII